MYASPDPSVILQGDILEEFIFIRRLDGPDTVDPEVSNRAVDTFVETEAKIQVRKVKAIIATQACDADRRDFVLVCPIFNIIENEDDLRDKGNTPTQIVSKLASLRGQKLGYYYYLEKSEQFGIDESYADLTSMISIKRDDLSQYTRLASINDYPRHILAYKLGVLFLRPAK